MNLSNCVPTVTVICRTFFGIIFCVNWVLVIGVTRPLKLPINLWNKFRSKFERGVYDSAQRIIILSLDFNCFCDLRPYSFPGCENTCMIPYEAVGVFSISSSFWTVPLWPTLAVLFAPPISNKFEYTRRCDLVRWLHRAEVVFPSIVFFNTPILFFKGGKCSSL